MQNCLLSDALDSCGYSAMSGSIAPFSTLLVHVHVSDALRPQSNQLAAPSQGGMRLRFVFVLGATKCSAAQRAPFSLVGNVFSVLVFRFLGILLFFVVFCYLLFLSE